MGNVRVLNKSKIFYLKCNVERAVGHFFDLFRQIFQLLAYFSIRCPMAIRINRKAVLQVHDGFSTFIRALNDNPTRCLFPLGFQTIRVRCCTRAFLFAQPGFQISRCLLAEAHHETPYPSHYFCGRKCLRLPALSESRILLLN